MSRRSRGGRSRRAAGGPAPTARIADAPELTIAAPASEPPPHPVPADESIPSIGATAAAGRSPAEPGGQFVSPPLAPRRPDGPNGPARTACTAPQLRRFIKSRVYVPLHELRRRFAIDGTEDDVSPLDLESGRVFVGLPQTEARLLQELLRAGDVGFELSRDPSTPIVVGLYPMRPVSRN